jgi:elongation factor G
VLHQQARPHRANFEMCVDMIRDCLGARPAVLYLPIGMKPVQGPGRPGRESRDHLARRSLGAKFEYQEIPDA